MEHLTMCVMDDIQAVVKGISSTIPWEDHQVQIVGTANNGERGWSLLLEQQPDIVITDIKMPRLSGLELMKRALDAGLRSKFIFISGYSDFQYAQEAIKLGASDYLLKPFTPDEILGAVLKVRQSIEGEQAQFRQLEQLEQKVVSSSQYERHNYLLGLLRHEIGGFLNESRWNELHIDLDSSNLRVMVIEVDGYTRYGNTMHLDAEIIPFAVQNIVGESLNRYTKGVVLRENRYRLAAIFNSPGQIDASELLEQCRHNVEQFCKKTISIGLGTIARRPQEIWRAYADADKAISYRFYNEGNCILRYADLENQEFVAPVYPLEKEKELFYALKCGNESTCHRIIDDILEEWQVIKGYPEPLSMIRLLSGLAFAIYRAFCDEITEEERLRLEADLTVLEAMRSLTFEGWKGYIKHFSSMGCEIMDKKRLTDVKQAISKAREFISLNLAENLTLQSCAQSVHLSPSYFANAFKKETGLTLIQYITKLRMERAKDLLVAGVQVQEICQMLGYEDRPYFSGLFKKYCGMTPTRFRQMYLN
ncbi:DNA-binding response regulator [Paenibacillus sp. PCH8]|uniref:helix-turn-helix domain-containing protein n=1 Tax=Paenibacillus sp. PCH8 TaxID=2066524 RepID=UPI000CF997BD|nr:response regulator [Paenibacillus sp. PCH8]PQP82417.1 DNA-binding response regulator [Paenibacillus sp. PCH8]